MDQRYGAWHERVADREFYRPGNPVERAPSVAAKVTARVKRWRDGDM